MTRSAAGRPWLVPLCLTLLIGGLVLPAVPVGANTLHVTNCGDAGPNTLRGEIAAAAVGDTIIFNQDCIITLTTGTLTPGQDVTIDGTGHTVIVDGGCKGCGAGGTPSGGVTVFTVAVGMTANLTALTIRNGYATGGGTLRYGGGIFNHGTLILTNCTLSGNDATSDGSGNGGGGGIANDGTLTLTNSTITNNQTISGSGGGIWNGGTLMLTNSTVSGNEAFNGSSGIWNGGGGIWNGGTLTITTSTLSGNAAINYGGGGGIFNYATLTMTDSTLANNASPGPGGGIETSDGPMTVTNCTISGNTTAAVGGGIDGGGDVTNCTISGNRANTHGGGIENDTVSTLSIVNTIVTGNTGNTGGSAADLGGAIRSDGHNLIGTTSGATITPGPGDLVNATPLLGPLGNNGGPTQTMPLAPGSPAIDAGNDTVCAQTGSGAVNDVDQRGIGRPQGQHCDIGAFEYKPTVVCRSEHAAGDELHRHGSLGGWIAAWGDRCSGGRIHDRL